MNAEMVGKIDLKDKKENALLECQKLCETNETCFFYIFERATYECTLYDNADKICRAKFGGPKGHESCDSMIFCTIHI